MSNLRSTSKKRSVCVCKKYHLFVNVLFSYFTSMYLNKTFSQRGRKKQMISTLMVQTHIFYFVFSSIVICYLSFAVNSLFLLVITFFTQPNFSVVFLLSCTFQHSNSMPSSPHIRYLNVLTYNVSFKIIPYSLLNQLPRILIVLSVPEVTSAVRITNSLDYKMYIQNLLMIKTKDV